jgi:hypothetical protein
MPAGTTKSKKGRANKRKAHRKAREKRRRLRSAKGRKK